MLTIILSLCCLADAVLAAIILYANYRNASNRWLSAFAICGLLWLLANLSANLASDPTVNLLFSRLTLVGASLLPLTYLFFCASFTKKRLRPMTRVYLWLPVVALLLTLPTKLYIASVTPGSLQIHPGAAYGALLAVLLTYFGYGMALLAHEYQRSEQMRRRQLYFILVGNFLTFVPAIILSVILPLLGNSQAVQSAPAFSLVFLLFTTVAIARHRLFDIRAFVLRAAAYGLTVVLVSIFYVSPTIWLLAKIAHVQLDHVAIAEFALVLLALGGLYRPVIKLLDQLTRRIFLRNDYRPQQVLDQLGDLLASSIDMTRLQEESRRILLSALNATFLEFRLDRSPDTDRIGSLFGETANQNVVLLDEAADHHKTVNVLKKQGVSVVVRLRMAPGGSGYIVLGPKRSGELYSGKDKGLLSTAADELAISFQNALQVVEIQNFNQTLQHRIEGATRRLRRSNKHLRDLDSAKDDFISMSSHQLRTPLTNIKGYISMVLDGDAGPINPQQRGMLDQAFRSSQQMVLLISDLLNLSRINTGKFVIEAAPVDLADVVDDQVSLLAETARVRGVSLKFDKPAQFPRLLLDTTKMQQVVMNMIDNALHYTPGGGTVTVALHETASTVQFTVRDTGIGVPRSEQRKLFGKLYRATNARQTRPDGSGLGLYMAKKIVAAEGGVIIFESEEGKGSTFGFRFNKAPLKVPDQASQPASASATAAS